MILRGAAILLGSLAYGAIMARLEELPVAWRPWIAGAAFGSLMLVAIPVPDPASPSGVRTRRPIPWAIFCIVGFPSFFFFGMTMDPPEDWSVLARTLAGAAGAVVYLIAMVAIRRGPGPAEGAIDGASA